MSIKNRYNYGNVGGTTHLVVAASDSSNSDKEVADYQCDGLSDEVQINSAFASASNGVHVHLAKGTYEIYNSIHVLYSKSIFTMDKNAVINVNQAQTTLAVQPAVDASTITVADGSGFEAGMYIRISDNAHCNVRRVASITDNVITLGEGYFSSETGNLAVTYAVGSDVVVVYDAVFVGNKSTDTKFITLDGINIDGQWDELEPADGAENGMTDDGSEKTDYYLNGIRILRTDNILIQDCHIVDVLYNSILFHGGSLSGSSRVLNNNILTSSPYSQSRGIAHEATDNYFIISGNIIETSASTADLTMNNGIYVNSSETYNYGVVKDNYIKGWYLGINFFGGNQNLSIKDNKVIACTYIGMQFIKTNYSVISGNTVDMRGGGLNGIYFTYNSPYCNRCIIAGNRVLNVNSGYKGMQIYGAHHTIIDNYIHTSGTMGNAIDVQSTYNNRIEGNVVTGNTNVGVGKEVTVSALACEPTCNNVINSFGGAVAATLADGSNIGQIIVISMRNATNSSTLTIDHHATSDPEVVTFDATSDWIALQWSGVEWLTIGTTCTFP